MKLTNLSRNTRHLIMTRIKHLQFTELTNFTW